VSLAATVIEDGDLGYRGSFVIRKAETRAEGDGSSGRSAKKGRSNGGSSTSLHDLQNGVVLRGCDDPGRPRRELLSICSLKNGTPHFTTTTSILLTRAPPKTFCHSTGTVLLRNAE
jgi:hypothetical protein